MKKLRFLIMVILSLVCVSLTGCGSKDAEMCELVVEDFLTAYQSLDNSAGEYLANWTEEVQFNGVQALLAKQMTFSVEKAKMKDGGYLVMTEISTIDFKATFESVATSVNEAASEETILDKLYDALESESPQIRTFSVNIPVQKYDEEYKVELTSELSNALFGGYNEYLSELTGGILNE